MSENEKIFSEVPLSSFREISLSCNGRTVEGLKICGCEEADAEEFIEKVLDYHGDGSEKILNQWGKVAFATRGIIDTQGIRIK